MDYRKKLKTRLYLAVCYTILGIAMILTCALKLAENDFLYSFGAMFAVIGIVRIIQYIRITKDEEALKKREIAETDERNVMLWTKARSMVFTVYLIAAACAVTVLEIMNLTFAATIIAYTILGLVVLYWICYLILSRKY